MANFRRTSPSGEEEEWDILRSSLAEAVTAAQGVVLCKFEYLLTIIQYFRPQHLYCDAFFYVCSGLSAIHATYLDEPFDARRYCDARVLYWLLEHVYDIVDPCVRNVEPCARRWFENVHLWCLRNFSSENYEQALHYMRRAPLPQPQQQRQTRERTRALSQGARERHREVLRSERADVTFRSERRTTQPVRRPPTNTSASAAAQETEEHESHEDLMDDE